MIALVPPEQFQFKGYVCKHGFGGVIPKPRAFTNGARDLACIYITVRHRPVQPPAVRA